MCKESIISWKIKAIIHYSRTMYNSELEKSSISSTAGGGEGESSVQSRICTLYSVHFYLVSNSFVSLHMLKGVFQS